MYMTAGYECSCGYPVQESAQPSSPSPSSGGRGSTKGTTRSARIKTSVRFSANDGEDSQDHSDPNFESGHVSETEEDGDDYDEDEKRKVRKQAKVDLKCMCNPPCDLKIGSEVAIVTDYGDDGHGVGSGM